MEMAAWIVVLPILLLVGLLLVGGLVLVVVLLVNPRTRPVGIVLAVLGALLLCGVVAAAALFWSFASYRVADVHATEARRRAEAADRLEQMREEFRAPPLPPRYPATEGESGAETEEPDAGTDTAAPHLGGGAAPEAPSAEPATSEPPSGSAGAGGSGADGDDAPAEEAGAEPADSAAAEAGTPAGGGPDASSTQETPPGRARPEWVESPPQRVGDGYQTSITVGPYTSRLECDAHLPAALQVALEEYLSIYLGPQWAGRIRLSPEVLERELVADRWEETIQASVGPMVQLHVLLDFDSEFRQTVCDLRDQSIVAGRLWVAGTGLGVVLAWLALAFAFLRIDQATAGAYRGRLAVGCVLAAVTVLIAAGVVLKAAQPATLALERLPAEIESEQLPPTLDGVLHGPAESHARSHLGAKAGATGPRAHGRLSVFALLVGAAALAGLVVLLAFRRTRVIGMVLLATGVIGALFLAAIHALASVATACSMMWPS